MDVFALTVLQRDRSVAIPLHLVRPLVAAGEAPPATDRHIPLSHASVAGFQDALILRTAALPRELTASPNRKTFAPFRFVTIASSRLPQKSSAARFSRS